MQKFFSLTYLVILGSLFFSCQQNIKYPYAIKDFRKDLQPALSKIATSGIVGLDLASEHFLIKNASHSELGQLAESELPVLRAEVLGILLHGTNADHYAILSPHLDDTARINKNMGEFGIQEDDIADYLIDETRFNDSSERRKLIEEVIFHHNYLNSAYKTIVKLDPNPKFYPYVKQMASNEIVYDEVTGYRVKGVSFSLRQNAYYWLAKFKKPEDVQLIYQAFDKNVRDLDEQGFKLMGEFPNPIYMDVLEKFRKTGLYWSIDQKQNEYIAIQYIKTIVSYKNLRSAMLLESLLKSYLFSACNLERYQNITDEMLNSIWDNECPVYAHLIKEISPMLHRKYLKLDLDHSITNENSYNEPIMW